jgi:hypothetical protein
MLRVLKPDGRLVFDVRNPFHITNMLTHLSLTIRRLIDPDTINYSFYTPRKIADLLEKCGFNSEVTGYFVLLPTQLPILGTKYGNWARLSSWLSFNAGGGNGRWLAQKLLVTVQNPHSTMSIAAHL